MDKSKNKHQCQFCMEFKGNSDSFYNLLLPNVPIDRTIFSYGGFKIFPPLGQFVEGSLMIVSEKHYTSCANLPAELKCNLEFLIEIIKSVLADRYRLPIFFEHGSGHNTKGSCCVEHAHIHVFPVKIDVHSILVKQYPYKIIKKITELNFLKPGRAGYIFLQQDSNRYYYPLEEVTPQLVRKIIASELGMPERGDWKSYIGLEEFNKTYDNLHSIKWEAYV